MSDIFISYKREEQATARSLANFLEKQGWSVWWDPKLRAGERFDEVIELAMKQARCVIVIWSRLSVNSEYVKDEASYALKRKKLAPVAIEQVELPFRFEGLHTPLLTDLDCTDDSPALLNLVEDIKRILSLSPLQPLAEGEMIGVVEKRRSEKTEENAEAMSRIQAWHEKHANAEREKEGDKPVKAYAGRYLKVGTIVVVIALVFWGLQLKMSLPVQNVTSLVPSAKPEYIDANLGKAQKSPSYSSTEQTDTTIDQQDATSKNGSLENIKGAPGTLRKVKHLIMQSDGTVIDTATSLMWMLKDFRCVEGRFLKNASWDEAMAWATKMNKERYAGYSDWMVPSIAEYRTLNKNKADRELYYSVFEDKGADYFWSRTEISRDVASYINFTEGYAVSGSKQNQRNGITGELFKFSVRLVRKS